MKFLGKLWNILSYLLALAAVFFFLFPIVWMFLTSLKDRVDVFATPPRLLFTPTLSNYASVLRSDFMGNLINSALIAVISTAGSIVMGSLTAYGFSRYGRFRGSENLLFWILSLRMLPSVAVAVPFYILFRTFSLMDTRIGLILVYSIFNISFSIWLLKGFFDEVPPDIEEAAMLEGYRPHQIFRKISLPLVKAGIATSAVFCLIQSLNEFLLALLLTSNRAVTAPVGLAHFQRQFGLEWGEFAAAATLFVLPVILFTILVRNQLIRGLSFGRLS
ncbi:MAG: carbohydrate ABC transporter permease [Armatimonadetes bacterium]|nr:carbohydrate ABC transporter permease [Armatimonadota bacterium]